MRVDAYNKVSQIYQPNSVKKSIKSEKTDGMDTLHISSVGRELQIAKQAVRNAPDIRQDKVDVIKEKMEAGTYHVDAKMVADKLVENFFKV